MSDKERDEIAREIFIGANSNQSREASIEDWEWFATTVLRGSYTKQYETIADTILAAGYRKPRTITTVAEMMALHMVVVRTAGGTIANIANERAYVFGYEASVPADTLALPATVLYEPTA